MLQRLTTAFDKLFFCYRIAANTPTFFRLIINTKKYALAKNKTRKYQPVFYTLKLNNQKKDIWLRTYAGDIAILYEIFWKKTYTYVNMPWQDLRTIVDLGANIGMSALYLNLQYKNATIYAVEPDEDNFELLTTNLADEILTAKLIPVRAAIFPDEGFATIKRAAKAYNTTVTRESSQGEKVKAVNMSTLMREMMINHIDLLKIDIEGWEEQLFSGNIAWLDNVTNVVMECHSEDIKLFCKEVLENKGFIILSGSKNFPALLWATKNT